MGLCVLSMLAASGCSSVRPTTPPTAAAGGPAGAAAPATGWRTGVPIVTYWAGPDMTDAVARQMVDGGWNLIWCQAKDLDVAYRHNARALLHDPLIQPATLDDPAKRGQLDALIERVKDHPALYSYFITDEPGAAAFAGLGKLVAYLRQRDPAHLAYINLFPTYASNEQLGTKGDVVTAYREHLSQFLTTVRPDLLSYDHYHFGATSDGDQYFLNLSLIRQFALDSGLPFLNIVQACSWTPSMRVPNGNEVRWLVSTSLAYGAQGISYYVYCYPQHTGAIARADGTPTELYGVLSHVNREFVAVAAELQPLRSLGAVHAGMVPPGASAWTAECPFRLEPPLPQRPYQPAKPAEGVLLGLFGREAGRPSHVLVVNLDYGGETATTVVGPSALERFAPDSGTWQRVGGERAQLRLAPGGSALLRVQP